MGMSTRKLLGICSIGAAILIAVALLIAWGCGAFSSKPQAQRPGQYVYGQPGYAQQGQHHQPGSQVHTGGPQQGTGGATVTITEDDPITTEEITQVDPSSRAAQLAMLQQKRDAAMALPNSYTGYKQIVPILNWVRLQSYYAMVFGNLTSIWVGDTANPVQAPNVNHPSVRAKANSILAQTSRNITKQDVDRLLWIQNEPTARQLINDIYIKANDLSNKKGNWFQHGNWDRKRHRKAFVKYACYHAFLEALFWRMNNVNTHPVVYYQLRDGSYVWRHGDILPHHVRRHVMLNGAVDPNKVQGAGGHPTQRGSIFQYLQAKKTASDDATFLSSIGKRDCLYGAAAVVGGIGSYCIVSALWGLFGSTCGSVLGSVAGISAFLAILWVGFKDKISNWMRH